MKKKVVPTMAVTLLSTYPVLFLFLNNVSTAKISEITEPLLVYLCAGILIYAISWIFTKSAEYGALISLPFILLFCNYSVIEDLLRSFFLRLRYWHILPICIFVLVHIAYLIYKKCPEDLATIIIQVMSGVTSVLIVVNLVMAIPSFMKIAKLNNKITDDDINPDQIVLNETSNLGELPNVYWLLFDEYSNFDVIEKYYNYNNMDFAEWLEERNFTVSYDSVNESQQTNTITANIAMLEYAATDDMSAEERSNIRKSGNLLPLFYNNGYRMNYVMGGEYFDPAIREVSSVSVEGYSISDLLLDKTPLYILKEKSANEKIKMIEDIRKLYQTNKVLIGDKPNFVLNYVLLPHQPFVVTENGSENSLSNWHNWVDKEHYLGQFKFTTNFLKDVIDAILRNDPSAIIVLQSDHSARSLKTADDKLLIEKFDRRHPLNAVYFAGESISEISGQSSVNTWRLVLNRLFDMNYSVLEVPSSEYEF